MKFTTKLNSDKLNEICLRKNVVNNVAKSSLWEPWQNGPFKNTQNITKHEVYKDATAIKK